MLLDRFLGIALALPLYFGRLFFLFFLWLLAGLFWKLISPSQNDQSLSMPQTPAPSATISREAFLNWLGTGKPSEDKPVSNVDLIAVIAGVHGAALFKSSDGSTTLVARTGEDIRPGTRLIRVESNQVTIENNGRQQTLKLPRKDAPEVFSVTEPSLQPYSSVTPAVRGIPISRGQLLRGLQGRDVNTWSEDLSSVADGGLRIDKAVTQPFAVLLQLRDGDILKTVNGRPLNQPADISLIAHYLGQQTTVDITLIRHGTLLTQHYQIRP